MGISNRITIPSHTRDEYWAQTIPKDNQRSRLNSDFEVLLTEILATLVLL